MKAVIAERYGGPEVLEIADDIPVPRVGPNGVLVRVHATSVNPVDWKLREGWLHGLWQLRFPVIWGCDVSGTVEEVGTAVTLFKPGDEVYGFKHGKVGETYRGTYAEYAVLPENTLALKPKSLTHEQAAAIPLAATTAWQALLNQAGIKPGHKLLVQAGAGGVGTFAIQIAKAFGAHVAATSGPANLDLLRQLGADEAIDYTREKVEDRLSGFDYALDGVGESVWASSLKVLHPGGRLITLTLPIPHGPTGRARFIASGAYGVISGMLRSLIRGKFFVMTQVKPRGGDLEKMNALIQAGKLRPIVQKVYPLEQIAEAHRESEKGHVRGKLVVKIRNE
jgi:NADPH:quinone reductase-like Zn-dependent oxidoreductase